MMLNSDYIVSDTEYDADVSASESDTESNDDTARSVSCGDV